MRVQWYFCFIDKVLPIILRNFFQDGVISFNFIIFSLISFDRTCSCALLKPNKIQKVTILAEYSVSVIKLQQTNVERRSKFAVIQVLEGIL